MIGFHINCDSVSALIHAFNAIRRMQPFAQRGNALGNNFIGSVLIAPDRPLQFKRTGDLTRPREQQSQNRQLLCGQFERSIPAPERPIGLEPRARKPIPAMLRVRRRRQRMVHRNQRSSVESLQRAGLDRDRSSRFIAGVSNEDSHRNHPGKAIHQGKDGPFPLVT